MKPYLEKLVTFFVLLEVSVKYLVEVSEPRRFQTVKLLFSLFPQNGRCVQLRQTENGNRRWIYWSFIPACCPKRLKPRSPLEMPKMDDRIMYKFCQNPWNGTQGQWQGQLLLSKCQCRAHSFIQLLMKWLLNRRGEKLHWNRDQWLGYHGWRSRPLQPRCP